jgi:hypothetical protein
MLAGSMMLVLICALVLLVVGAGFGTVLLLIKFGIIANEASRPKHANTSSYTLDQGREVGNDNRQQ